MQKKSAYFILLVVITVVAAFVVQSTLTSVTPNKNGSQTSQSPFTPAASTPTNITSTNQDGVPFGPFHLPTSQYGDNSFTGAFLDVSKLSVSETEAALDAARKNRMRLIVTLAGGGNNFEDASSHYSYEAFKTAINRYKSLDLSAYSDVVIGNLIMDEPQDRNNWGGQAVTNDEIKKAAEFVKSMWPGIPVGVGSNPSFLSGGNWEGKNVDFVSVPFTEKRLQCRSERPGCYGATVEEWLSGVVADAKAQNLGLVLSINVLDGGAPRGSEISSANLEKYGTLFAKSGYACALTFWKWDSAYFERSDIQTALRTISNTASKQSFVSCRPH